MAVAHRFAHGHDVGLDAVRLEGPEMAAHPAEAGLHLVGHAEPAACPHRAAEGLQVAGRQVDLAAAGEDRLGEEGGRQFAAGGQGGDRGERAFDEGFARLAVGFGQRQDVDPAWAARAARAGKL